MSRPFPEPIKDYSVPGTGLVFYGDPATLTEAQIDPLLWPIVQRINESGWVWTAEACQGHPESEEASPEGQWAMNHRAMIRLVCRVGDLGKLLALVAEAVQPRMEDGEFGPTPWEPWVSFRPEDKSRYTEALIYIGRAGQHVGGRNRAIRAWTRFADAAVAVPMTDSHEPRTDPSIKELADRAVAYLHRNGPACPEPEVCDALTAISIRAEAAPEREGLDVERLRAAIEKVAEGIADTDDGGYADLPNAEEVAAEYARLAPTSPSSER